jgi:hypothetical protein
MLFEAGSLSAIETPSRAQVASPFEAHVGQPRVQSGARRHGIAGIHGIGGNLESATYRI